MKLIDKQIWTVKIYIDYRNKQFPRIIITIHIPIFLTQVGHHIT